MRFEISGTWWFDGAEEGFTWVDDAEATPEKPTGLPKPKKRGGQSREDLDVSPSATAPASTPGEPSLGEKARRTLKRRLRGD